VSEHDAIEHEPSRTKVPMPIATLGDPHLGDAAKNPSRTEAIIALILLIGTVLIAGFGAAYWQNWNPWIIGGTLGAGMFLLGFGLTAWGKYLMPQGPFVEERHVLASSSEERSSMAAALVERSTVVVKRRKLLGGIFALGSGIFGIVLMLPLLRSLGPVPKTSLDVTDWRKGSLLVDSNGRSVNKGTLVVGGLMTVYPHGKQDSTYAQSVDQTVLIRVQDTDLVTAKGRETWAPAGYVAYSKVCTHLGCPVGLYEQQLELLVCPCHQSMFNVRNGAIPQFGPAPRPLPQLPLYFDADGNLRAQDGFDQAPGPGFFERTTTKENGT
jgi:ubiquinol-cytochrome c reductase iron-sulfur subunit